MTRPQNTILDDIVIASSGTIRNPHNRNELLIDWLLALGGTPLNSAFQGFDDPVNCNGVIYCNQIIGCN